MVKDARDDEMRLDLAIRLKVPDSGVEWVDQMIRRSRSLDLRDAIMAEGAKALITGRETPVYPNMTSDMIRAAIIIGNMTCYDDDEPSGNQLTDHPGQQV